MSATYRERAVTPSRVLNIYYLVTFTLGLLLTIPVAHWVQVNELGPRGAAVMILCWNVLFVMLLPFIMDFSERRYFKARFMELEEVAKTNPQLAQVIAEQCQKLSISTPLKFAVVDSQAGELFSYGLGRNNPRLVVSDSLLKSNELERLIPSVEAELSRFATQDNTFLFLAFAVLQLILQNLIIAFCRM